MKYIKIFLILGLSLIMCGCKNNDELVLATEAGFAPYEFYDNDKIVGVDIEIGKAIADEMGKKLVVKDVAFDSIINEIKKGKSDIGAAGISITEERKEEVDFSIEYALSKQVVIVNGDSTITNPEEIFNKKVGVQLGTTADIFLSEKMNDKSITRQKKYLSLVEDLKANKVDAIVMDSLPANLKILDKELFEDKYGMVVKKGNDELLDTVNKVLEKLMEEGKIDSWTIEYSKWCY
mgnify:CR=1 FL=1